MKRLTLNEQIFLVAVWRLKDEAYGVKTREAVIKMTGGRILFGTVYNTLDYLSQKGLVASQKTQSPSRHGGNNRVYYRLTEAGREALENSRKLQDAIWEGIPRSAFAGNEE